MEIISFGTGSKGNSILIKEGKDSILLDAGISPKKIPLSRREMRAIQAVFITHEHKDHARYTWHYLNMAIDVYMTEGTQKELNMNGHHHLKIVTTCATCKQGNWRFVALKAEHDAAEPVTYYIYHVLADTFLLYATDTRVIRYNFKRLNHAIIEANYDDEILDAQLEEGVIHPSVYKRIKQAHMSFQSALDFAVRHIQAGLVHVYLTHLSEHNADAKFFKLAMESQIGLPVTIL